MHRDSLHDAIRSLDCLSDAQIAALTFPKGGLQIQTPIVVTERYAGATKLPPGPPNGLESRADGGHNLTRVAIVRVQPDEYRLLATAMIKRGTRQSIMIGAICGLMVAAGTFAAMLWWQNDVRSLEGGVPPPCLIAGISLDEVSCRIGDRTQQVKLGKFFPDGRYVLDAVNPVHSGFTATRITDRQIIVFQADSKLITSQSGAAQK